MNSLDLRRFYARLATAKGGASDAALLRAFETVDRVAHLGPGPWKVFTACGYIETPSDDPAFVFQDVVVALKPELGINNGEPSLHARCLASAELKPGETVVHVGAGFGYYTAILAELVGPSGKVEAYEVDPDLAGTAARLLCERPNVAVHARSALDGPLPEADLIYVNAGLSHPPAVWLDALRPGGRLIMPLTAGQGPGLMLRLTRTEEDVFAVGIVSGAMFIPCVGGQDEAEAQALLRALQSGRHAAVRSLRRGGEPEEDAWLSGDGWWFSTREP
jgi:protein-L-isoaspartate(D-aspartate) O-methyltransferase